MRCHGGAPAPPLRIRADRLLSHWLLFGLLGLFPFAAQAAQPIHYAVDLSVPETHLVHVTVTIPDAAAGTEIADSRLELSLPDSRFRERRSGRERRV